MTIRTHVKPLTYESMSEHWQIATTEQVYNNLMKLEQLTEACQIYIDIQDFQRAEIWLPMFDKRIVCHPARDALLEVLNLKRNINNFLILLLGRCHE